jgi:hypothetical protein
MFRKTTVDLSRTKRTAEKSIFDFLVTSSLIFYLTFSIVALITNRHDLILMSLLFVAPIVMLMLFLQQLFQWLNVKGQAIRLAQGLQSAIPLLDADLNLFDVQIAKLIRDILDETNSRELRTIGSLLGYGRILGIKENIAPILEGDRFARQKLPKLLDDIAFSLSTLNWTDSMENVGRLLAYLASLSLRDEEQDQSNQVTPKEFARYLRNRSTEIFIPRLWVASSNIFDSLLRFGGSYSKQFAPWAALILFWLNAHIHFLGNRSVKEKGVIFASEYELLSHQLLGLANAVETEDWDRVAEVLIASHETSHSALRFGLRRPSTSLS